MLDCQLILCIKYHAIRMCLSGVLYIMVFFMGVHSNRLENGTLGIQFAIIM